LTPDMFPRIIASWEQHFVSHGFERSLENCLQQWISILRSWANRLPDPLLPPQDSAPPGNTVTS
jgi:hypothetical protein